MAARVRGTALHRFPFPRRPGEWWVAVGARAEGDVHVPAMLRRVCSDKLGCCGEYVGLFKRSGNESTALLQGVQAPAASQRGVQLRPDGRHVRVLGVAALRPRCQGGALHEFMTACSCCTSVHTPPLPPASSSRILLPPPPAPAPISSSLALHSFPSQLTYTGWRVRPCLKGIQLAAFKACYNFLVMAYFLRNLALHSDFSVDFTHPVGG
jgi:hypothetical protein